MVADDLEGELLRRLNEVGRKAVGIATGLGVESVDSSPSTYVDFPPPKNRDFSVDLIEGSDGFVPAINFVITTALSGVVCLEFSREAGSIVANKCSLPRGHSFGLNNISDQTNKLTTIRYGMSMSGPAFVQTFDITNLPEDITDAFPGPFDD